MTVKLKLRLKRIILVSLTTSDWVNAIIFKIDTGYTFRLESNKIDNDDYIVGEKYSLTHKKFHQLHKKNHLKIISFGDPPNKHFPKTINTYDKRQIFYILTDCQICNFWRPFKIISYIDGKEIIFTSVNTNGTFKNPTISLQFYAKELFWL